MEDRYFFAYGTSPSDKGDSDNITAAADMIWPVMINWAHLTEDGAVQSSNASVSCMTNQGYRYSSAGAAKGVSGLALWGALGAALLLTGAMV